jgi:hypothetical protein
MWRFYFVNGSTFDSSQGDPNDTPSRGGAFVMQRDLTPPNRPEQVKGENFYYWGGPSMQWRGADGDAVIEALLEGEVVEGLIQGRRMARTEFFALTAVGNADPDFQP